MLLSVIIFLLHRLLMYMEHPFIQSMQIPRIKLKDSREMYARKGLYARRIFMNVLDILHEV